MSECTPTEADREDAKLFLIGLSLDGTDETPQSLPAEGVDDIVAELAALFAKVRADERAKRPDREQIERTVRAHRVWWNFETGSLCQCGWKCLLSEHPAHVADAVLALEPEAREEAELFHDQDGDLWKLTDKGEWFHEEEPGEFRQVLSIDAEDQTLTPVGHAELAPDAEAAREVE